MRQGLTYINKQTERPRERVEIGRLKESKEMKEKERDGVERERKKKREGVNRERETERA